MSKRFLILTSSLWLCGFFSAHAQTKISNQEPDPSAKEVKKLFSSISCSIDSKDVHRSWCPVTKMGTSPLSIPHQLTSYFGISVPLFKNENNLKKAFLDRTELAILHLGPKTAKVTTLTPSNPKESQQLVSVLMQVAIILKTGNKQSIEVFPDLAAALTTEQTKTLYPLTIKEQFASFQAKLPTTLYCVQSPSGLIYVSIGTDGNKGWHVSVFPAVPITTIAKK